jgi:nitrogen fixation/metabolism regulation signal transduction histidine kinase
MASVILVSFLVVGIFSLYYIINLNDQKNKDIISEKTHSVLVELQQKLSDEISLDSDMTGHVNDYLAKFSSVFFTDINLFDLHGNLYSTSRPEIYDEFLISRKMNSTAYRELSINKMSLYIQTEHIGKQNYLSAYIPFVNSQNSIIAYLNLPYFAKQNDLKREISTFLIAYINIYVILISLSILIALVISNYVARPIKLIMGKIGKINLGGKNERIVWTRKDEIGQLVNEYNRMIDELALSADLLAKSERENAWREMAKQVAHEIKNPLTPMKLSVQYLQKAYNDNAPDWDKRLDKFTQTMIEQIETLSTIATEFSDFAKMPDFNRKAIDISEIIGNAISLFRNYTEIQITFNPGENLPYIVLGDKEQLLRAFNNLLKNAIQAIDVIPGKVEISIRRQDNYCQIEVFDNGKGIPQELSEKIFSPNFTTKSGGMGLGLAIVKNIIVSSGGEITFTSEPGKGTSFKILLPQIPINKT